jgi:hypothetical protein
VIALLRGEAIMTAQLIDFKNPKDYSTGLFRVVRLRYCKEVVYPKTGEVLQSAREEPTEVYLCSCLNKKSKVRTYEWMSKNEVEIMPQWRIHETSSIQKMQDLVADNRIYFLNLEMDTNRSDLFSYGPAYALPVQGVFILVKTIFDGPKVVEEYMQVASDKTTVVSTYIPFSPIPKHVHWTRTPSRAGQIDTMQYPYLRFIAEFCKAFSEAICAPLEQYSFRYVSHSNVCLYSPSSLSLTLLAAKGGAPPESRPSDLEIDAPTTLLSTSFEEKASSQEKEKVLRDPLSLAAEIEQMHASLYLSQEQTLYQKAEKIVELMCQEEMEVEEERSDCCFEENKENVDPNAGLEDQYALYLEWASSLEDPCLPQVPYPSWTEQMHSEGLLVSSGTL